MRRFQFSLRKLLLVIAAVVVVASHGLTSYRLWKAERELRTLQIRQGILVVEDETKIQVVRVDLQQPMTWRWRVYLPPGRNYVVAYETGDIQQNGFPAVGASMGLYPGERTITAKIQRDERGDWTLLVYVNDDSRAKSELPNAPDRWPELSHGTRFSATVSKSFDSSRPAELLRLRASVLGKPGITPEPPPEGADGVLIWLDDEKNQP
jgi:hypothetical protein